MERFAEWFYEFMCPWSSDDYLAIAAAVAFVLILISCITILILVTVYNKCQTHFGKNKLYFIVAYFCVPLISFSFSLLFKWYVAAAILTVIFVAVFLSSKEDESATTKNFVRFYLANIILPNLFIVALSFLGLPYLL